MRDDFDALAIIAPPKALGVLKKCLHKEVERRIVCTVNKEMSGRPIPDIEALLNGHTAPEELPGGLARSVGRQERWTTSASAATALEQQGAVAVLWLALDSRASALGFSSASASICADCAIASGNSS